MSEKKLIIDQLRLNYTGLFNMNEFYKTIMAWFYERGYDMFERRNCESITPTGKYLEIELIPWKKASDYAKSEMRVRLWVKDLKDVEINKEGVKLKLQQGELRMTIDAWLVTDWEGTWESEKKPYLFFFRTLVNKFIFKSYMQKSESMVVSDVHHLHSRLKGFLNMYKTA